jgi:hypothetical protein
VQHRYCTIRNQSIHQSVTRPLVSPLIRESVRGVLHEPASQSLAPSTSTKYETNLNPHSALPHSSHNNIRTAHHTKLASAIRPTTVPPLPPVHGTQSITSAHSLPTHKRKYTYPTHPSSSRSWARKVRRMGVGTYFHIRLWMH